MPIPKSELKHGEYYAGECRNAGIARWNADKQVFVYWRNKFRSMYLEEINHFEDDDGADLFIPEAVTEPDCNIPL